MNKSQVLYNCQCYKFARVTAVELFDKKKIVQPFCSRNPLQIRYPIPFSRESSMPNAQYHFVYQLCCHVCAKRHYCLTDRLMAV